MMAFALGGSATSTAQILRPELYPIGFHYALNHNSLLSGQYDLARLGGLDSLSANVWQVPIIAETRSAIEDSAAVRGVRLIRDTPRSGTGIKINSAGDFSRIINALYHAEDAWSTCRDMTFQSGATCDHVPVGGYNVQVGVPVVAGGATTVPVSLVVPTTSPAYTAMSAPLGTPGRLFKTSQATPHYISHFIQYPQPIRVTVRMKIGLPAERVSSDVTVVRFWVGYRPVGQSTTNYTLHEFPISHFIAGSWKNVTFDTNMSGQTGYFDLIAETTGVADVMIDSYRYAREATVTLPNNAGQLPRATPLLNGVYDSLIDASYSAYPSWRVYMVDEPAAWQFRSTGYVQNRIGSLGPSYIPFFGSDDIVFLERFVQTVGPSELVIDPYTIGRIRWDDYGDLPSVPGLTSASWGIKAYDPTTYLSDLRERFDFLALSLRNARAVSQAYSIPFWYIAQAHGEYDSGTMKYTTIRPPTPEEASVQAWMGVAYGAKGSFYFLYESVGPFPGIVSAARGHSSDYDPSYPGTPWTGYHTRFEAMVGLNATLAAIGPTLLGLTSVTAYSSNEPTPSGSFVQSIQTLGTPSETSSDFQIGTFSHGSTSDRFLAIVNRRTRPTDTRYISIQISGPSTLSRTVKNVATGQVIATIPSNQSLFSVTLPPGGGMLLRISNAIDSSSDVSGGSPDESLVARGTEEVFEFALHQPVPNPVRDAAVIDFELAEASEATLALYDATGRRIAVLAHGEHQAGRHRARLDTRSLPSGVYFYRLSTPSQTAIQRLTVVK